MQDISHMQLHTSKLYAKHKISQNEIAMYFRVTQIYSENWFQISSKSKIEKLPAVLKFTRIW